MKRWRQPAEAALVELVAALMGGQTHRGQIDHLRDAANKVLEAIGLMEEFVAEEEIEV